MASKLRATTKVSEFKTSTVDITLMHEGLVTERLRDNGYPIEQVLNLGDEHSYSRHEIIDQMVVQMPSSHVLVVGFVNIHTHQAEEMLEYFEHEAEPWLLADGLEGAAS